MKTFEWSDSLSLGVRALDKDHRKLLELVNDLARGIESDHPEERLGHVFDELLVYVNEHFAREEGYMQQAGYPGFVGHKEIHARLKDKMLALRANMGGVDCHLLSQELIEFLNAWLLNHIALSDMQLKPYLTDAGLTDIPVPRLEDNVEGEAWQDELAWSLNALADGERLVTLPGVGRQDKAGDIARAFERVRTSLIRNDLLVAENKTDYLSLKNAQRAIGQLSEVVKQLPVSVVITDIRGHVVYVNPHYELSTGMPLTLIKGDPFPLMMIDETGQGMIDCMWETLEAGRNWEEERVQRDPKGGERWDSISISPIKEGERVVDYVVVIQDITERKQHEARFEYQALHDGLTGLPNRSLVLDRLGQAIEVARREEEKLVLMFIDLDDFKKVNDSLGHHVGDHLLVAASRRIIDAVRASDTVARQGGDEFIVVAAGLEHRSQAEPIAHSILRALDKPFEVEGVDLRITCSIGFAFYPDDGGDADALMREADAAMYRAKADGGGMFRYFDVSMDNSSTRRLELERRLHHAIEHGALYPVYQPLVDAATSDLLGAEVLLRWRDEELGQVGPEEFIPVAESTGLIVAIGDRVLKEAIKQSRLWSLALGRPFLISVNASPRQLLEENFVERVRRHMRDYALPNESLQIEVTEGLLVRNKKTVQNVLQGLHEAGVKIAMDDFGTGYSSLSHLREFPFDVIKIDRSFVRDMCTDDGDRALVFATVALAQSLDLKVTAEGVETLGQQAALCEVNCHTLQGYLFSKPLETDEFERRFVVSGSFEYDLPPDQQLSCASQ